jgi:hypothetical protein
MPPGERSKPRELEQENGQLGGVNEILKRASDFFE